MSPGYFDNEDTVNITSIRFDNDGFQKSMVTTILQIEKRRITPKQIKERNKTPVQLNLS